MRLIIFLLGLIGSVGGLSAGSPDRPRTEVATTTAAKNRLAAADIAYCAYPERRPAAAFTIRHPAWSQPASICEVNIRQYSPEGTFREFERAQ